MLDVARMAVDAAIAAGADFADARAGTDESESLTVRNQEMEGIDRSISTGVGIRVLVRGRWGFASTSRAGGAEIDRTARLAVAIAEAAHRLPGDPVALTPVEPATASWRTVVEEDPFTVPLEEKVALLMEASRVMQGVPGLSFGEASLDFFRRSTWFASSDGAAIEQVVTNSGGGIEATAVGDGDMQRRSYPNSFRGHVRAAGYEHIRTLGLVEEAERIGGEAVALLSAPECPSEVTTLVLDSGQLALQIHESIGHPIELDRVLGMEEAYAGSSWLSPGDRGRVRYGSDLVSITADATVPGGLGTFGFDDEGVPAQRVPVIVDGTFENFLSSRETAARGRPGLERHEPGRRVEPPPADPHDEHLDRAAGGHARRDHRRHRRRHLHDDEQLVVDRRQADQLPVRMRAGQAHRARHAHHALQEPELHGHHAGVLGLVRRGRRRGGLGRVGHAELREGTAGPGRAGRPRCVACQVPRRASGGTFVSGHGTSLTRFRDVQIGVRS